MNKQYLGYYRDTFNCSYFQVTAYNERINSFIYTCGHNGYPYQQISSGAFFLRISKKQFMKVSEDEYLIGNIK
jgi:hypothetical protein